MFQWFFFFSSLTLACKEVNHFPVRYVQLGDKDDT